MAGGGDASTAGAVVGLDVCRGGWVAVVLDGVDDAGGPRGGLASAYVLASITELEHVVDAAVVGIDIPIGLVDDRLRAADLAARAALGPRRNSVFMTPVRAAVEASTHAAASAVNRQRTGLGISRQAYNLRDKILEVDRWLGTGAREARHVVEVHPEVSFTTMLGHPPRASKKSWQGMVERRAALDAAGIDVGAVDERVGAAVGIDDLLDAAAVAWTARRVRDCTATCLPDPPELDPRGQPIAIWS